MIKLYFLISIFLILLMQDGKAQPEIDLMPYVPDLSNPIGINEAGDDRLFVIEQRGLIRIIQDGDLHDDSFLDLTGIVDQSGNETGLLGLAFHPEFADNGYFFVNYTSDQTTYVVRYTIDPNNDNQADPETQKLILTIDQPYNNHNAGNLLFGPDGYLYIAVGDGGSGGDPQNYAQNPASLLGKMLRIDIDVDDSQAYAIPSDNPFVNDENYLDEIWALGLRNHWRNSFDRITGDLWIADVGQSEREEINFQPASSTGGENYGWRCYEGNLPYNLSGCDDPEVYTFPVFEYEHQGTGCTGSVTGGFVYRGALYNALYGAYVAADYCTGNFYMVKQTDQGFESDQIGTFLPFQYSSFGEDQYGELYLALRGSGEIQQLVELSDCTPVAQILEQSPVFLDEDVSITLKALYHPLLEYRWFWNDEEITGETTHMLEIFAEGSYSVEVKNSMNECFNVSEVVEVTASTGTLVNLNVLEDIHIYPNPVGQVLRIDGLPSDGQISYQMLDVSGKTILAGLVDSVSSHTIEIQGINPGIYILQLNYEGKSALQRKIVIND